MESDDSHSSNSTDSSNSSSNGPASPAEEQLSPNSNTGPVESTSKDNGNQSTCPQKVNFTEDAEEDIELSDIEEPKRSMQADMSHEDLSDISDLESSNETASQGYTDLRHKLNKLNKHNRNGSESNENVMKKSDEEELDFEGDEDIKDSLEPKKGRERKESNDSGSIKEDGEHKSDKEEPESGEELEDGEVTDGDEKRPEESEPKAVCRFFTRGQCTWGMSCRFLHPGTTDKGNYTMFELVRPMPNHPAPMMMPAYDYRTERPPLHHVPPHAIGGRGGLPGTAEPESAWERGLRTAKEMLRKANKRKELDIDFDEKKMNLSGPPDEIERDPYYHHGSPADIASFERERIVERRMPPSRGIGYSPPAKFPRPSGPSFYEEDQYGRMSRSYRELPAHRMPHYEDDDISKRRTARTTTREVIVEKADDWNDPWMRKGDPGKDKKVRGRERSYSSNSSYSSSSTSTRSHSSSDTSRSPSPSNRRGARFDGQRSKDRPPATSLKIDRPKSRSSSLKRRHSPTARPRLPIKKAPSPIAAPKRKKPGSSPPRNFNRRKKRNSSSGSSSGSESGSSFSSSTSSSNKAKKKREKIITERKVSSKKVSGESIKKPRTPPPILKDSDEKLNEKAAAAAKLKSSRREELLKQLRAVEDAIARKRSKIT